MKRIIWTTQKKLAAKLGVSIPTVGKWVFRSKGKSEPLIRTTVDELTGVTLVEDIDGKPTRQYIAKEIDITKTNT